MFPLDEIVKSQLHRIKGSVPTLIFPEATEPRIIEAVSALIQYAKVVLAGSREQVERAMDVGQVPLRVSRRRFFQSVAFINPEDHPELAAEFADVLLAASQGRSWQMTPAQAHESSLLPTYFSILAVRCGYADAVLGGLCSSSKDFFRPCLRLLERSGTVYEMGLFALPDSHVAGIFHRNLVMFADVALNPEPSPERLADIAVGACVTLRNIVPVEELPEINGALVSYSTRGSGEGPSVDRVRSAEPIIEEQLAKLRADNPLYKTIHIATELQIGCAVSKEAARTKLGERADENPAIGASNVLIVPGLDAGNLLYHMYATRYPDSQTVLIIGGLKNQALDFSRSSRTADVINGAMILVLRMLKSGRFHHTPRDTFFPRYRILTVSPGYASTEMALWRGRDIESRHEVLHDAPLVASAPMEQVDARIDAVRTFLAAQRTEPSELAAVVAIGGLLPPLRSGVYRVDDAMISDLRATKGGSHIANTGAIIARAVAGDRPRMAFVVDPPVVDELDDAARISGLAGYEREAIWHALTQKAAARRFAVNHGRELDELNLLVVYLGTGISVGVHRKGRCVQVNNALFEGPMGAQRTGGLSNDTVIRLCYSGLSQDEVRFRLLFGGGLFSHLGTGDMAQIEARITAGDPVATVAMIAMTDQIAAEIGAAFTRFKGETVDRLIMTGPLCVSSMLIRQVAASIIALGMPMDVHPGNEEMEALRDGALRVLRGIEKPIEYADEVSRL